uniref:Uncharacterized protein n=1 Tax=Candidatus Desulfatibia profunda TaxID=2841695 RepID=A0A8J6TLH7_9BACT|nr:hypothetical protein [Candidatus Desulfatibia profunda]
MSTNVEQFSVFTAAVLDKLYDHFPELVTLQQADFLEDVNVAHWFAEMDKALEQIPKAPGSFARAEAAAGQAETVTQRFRDHAQRKEILRGTINFLIAEGLVRCEEPFSEEMVFRGCQLTSKGFTHLHKEFKDKRLSDETSTVIRWIKERFTSSSSVEGALIVDLITKFLG